MEVFVGRPDSPESRPFGLTGAEVLAISKSGEMAVSLDRHLAERLPRTGTLAQVGIAGGVAPRDVLEEVEWADWAPDGKTLAIVRDVRGGASSSTRSERSSYQTAAGSATRESPGRQTSWPSSSTPASATTADRSPSWTAPARSRALPSVRRPRRASPGRPTGREIWFTGDADRRQPRPVRRSAAGTTRLRVR